MVFHGICPSTGEKRFIFQIIITVHEKESSLHTHLIRSIAEYLGVTPTVQGFKN